MLKGIVKEVWTGFDVSQKGFNLNICQWNCPSSTANLSVWKFINSYTKNTYYCPVRNVLGTGLTLKLSNYNIYRTGKDDGYGVIAIVMHRSLKSHIQFTFKTRIRIYKFYIWITALKYSIWLPFIVLCLHHLPALLGSD